MLNFLVLTFYSTFKRLKQMTKKDVITIRVTKEDKEMLLEKAYKNGFTSLSEYMLFVAKNANITVMIERKI